MKWKLFLTAFINMVCIAFPYNIIGCAMEPDYYDYSARFFRNDLSAVKGYHPFYFINDQFLYEDMEHNDLPYAVSGDWIAYCKSNISLKEAYEFVCGYPYEDIEKLYDGIAGGQPFTMPATLRNNNMAKYFVRSKDMEGLDCLLFARTASGYYGSEGNGWEVPTGDEPLMDSLIKSGLKTYTHAKKDFIRARYAYQLTRLAFYNNHLADCARYYEMVKNNPSAGVLRNLSLSLKAGALLKMGKKKEAAYCYSLAFSRSTLRRRSNYISFGACVGRLNQDNRRDCLAFCKSDEERANLLGLFALGSNVPEAAVLQKIYKLYPRSEMLEILAIREINKIEDKYFSPSLGKQKGGKKLYMEDWFDEDADKQAAQWQQEAVMLAGYYHSIAQNPSVPNKALFETGAAYLSYITRQYDNANAYLDKAAALPCTQKIKDQQAMTRLLVTINQRTTIDSSFEAILLPSVQWLEKKARQEGRNVTNSYYEEKSNGPWIKCYRGLLSEILAKRYHRQGDVCREMLCIGVAEKMLGSSEQTKDFARNDMQTRDVLAMYRLVHAGTKSDWDAYLCRHFSMKPDEVREVIATNYTRDYRFGDALQWLQQIKDPELLKLELNPFGDPLLDWTDTSYAFDKGYFSKPAFIREMYKLQRLDQQGKASAKELYKLANGYYNMTFYGRAWQSVKFYRSTMDWYDIVPGATAFEREYYGCFTAERCFRKAMLAGTDNNFKARCLFMMAKCAQKQALNADKRKNSKVAVRKGVARYENSFYCSKYFPRLVKEYGNTPFYKEAFSTCSYLRDFVKENK